VRATAAPLLTTATERVKPNFPRRRLLQGLLAGYAAFWVWMATRAAGAEDWLLENLLVFVLVGMLAATYRRFPLSDMSSDPRSLPARRQRPRIWAYYLPLDRHTGVQRVL